MKKQAPTKADMGLCLKHAMAAMIEAEAEMAELRKDAARYRWLRAQNWNDGLLAVVADPKDAVKLGYDCPSLARLDEQIDAALMAQRAVGAD